MRFEFLVRAGIDSVSINPDAAVFTRKLVASIEQRIMLEKALGQVKVDLDWDLSDPGEEYFFQNLIFPEVFFFTFIV
jgi:hypothetical protein